MEDIYNGKTIRLKELYELIDLAEKQVTKGGMHGFPGGDYSDLEVEVWSSLCRLGRHCRTDLIITKNRESA